MRTSLIIAILIILHKVPKTRGDEKFACPKKCPANFYRPVCSRGKSYRNLCVLQQEICRGTTAREIYDDVEDCPGFEKEDDASGKSVEAVDRNGVVFRRFSNSTKKELSAFKKSPITSTITTVRTRYKSSHSEKARTDERSKQTCFLRLCLLGNHYFPQCPNQLRLHQGLIRFVPILFVGNILSPLRTKKGRNKKVFHIPVSGDTSKRSKNRVNRVDLLDDPKFCQINCNINGYRPVCVGKRAFRSECHLKKSFCSGLVGKDVFETAKKCPKAQNRRKKIKTDFGT